MIETFRVGTATLAYECTPAAQPGASAGPFIFQHGMGGNLAQPQGYVGDRPPVPVICLSARGHAPSSDLIDPAEASFDVFADDLIALADHLDLARFAVGGISLGAGTAINLALRHPHRITALVLCRPAWLDRGQPAENQAAYRELADLLDGGGMGNLAEGSLVERYRQSATYRSYRDAVPAAAASLLGQLTRPRAAENSLLLRALPADRPTPSADAWTTITVPTLVIGHRDDPFHPYAMAEAYAAAIPGAQLCTVPSKDADPDGFAGQIRAALHDFLQHPAASR